MTRAKLQKVLPRATVRNLDHHEAEDWMRPPFGLWALRAAFALEIEPKAKGRPRFSRVSGRTYTPKTTEDWETTVGRSVAGLCAIDADEIVRVEMVAVLPRPLSRPKDVPPSIWKLGGEIMRSCGPDTDNVSKALLDAIQYRQARKTLERLGFLDDDRQIADLLCRRLTARAGGAPELRIRVASLVW